MQIQAAGAMSAKVTNVYQVTCHRAYHVDGTQCFEHASCQRRHRMRLVWRDGFKNLVTTVGLNKLLDATLKTGLSSPAWYVGLVDNAGFSAFAAADTSASHGGWTESTAYSDGTRQAFTPGAIAAGSVSNSASKATFNINATATLKGAFMIDNSTKGGSTGTLYGEGAFSSNRDVASGDVLSVTVTATIS